MGIVNPKSILLRGGSKKGRPLAGAPFPGEDRTAARLCGCGPGFECSPDQACVLANPDLLDYLDYGLGHSWEYDVEIGAAVLEGREEIIEMEADHHSGRSPLRIERRRNQVLVHQRWVYVDEQGLFMVTEQTLGGPNDLYLDYQTPIKLLPIPLEDDQGNVVASWSSQSELASWGTVEHDFEFVDMVELSVQAGTFQAYHLIHTITDREGVVTTYDEYFVPHVGYVQFEDSEGGIWKLR